MSEWRKWWLELADKPVGFAIDDLRKLHEGYRLLAEAVEARAAVDEHPDGDCEECCGEFSPHCDVLFELGRVADEAGRKALDHLRGVGLWLNGC